MATEIVQLKVSGLMCSFCTMSVETALKRYKTIKSVRVNLVHGIVLVEADTSKISKDALTGAIEKLGYTVSETEVQQYQSDASVFNLIKKRGAIGMAVSITDLLVDPLNLFGLPEQYRKWFSLIVAALVLFWIGYPILKKTIMAIRQRVINANVLVSAGAWGAFIIGVLSVFNPAWPNFLPVAAWLMSLHLFFAYFKLGTRKKAADAVRKLLNLQPAKARVFRANKWVEILTTDVLVGETAEIKPGERIPLDGLVIKGSGSVDQSGFTGESNPVFKKQGAKVIGGTLNLDGVMQIEVTKKSEDGFLNQIVRMMSRINEKKPPVELLADRLMNYYGPVVFIIAIAASVIWLLVSQNPYSAAVVLITTIIMGYPCALGITTPLLAAIAGGKGLSIGLLVKASEVFYGLSKVDTIVFDKTGTLTYGKPTVTDVLPLGISEERLLRIAGTVEEKSEHPLAQSIAFYAKKNGVLPVDVDNFKAIAGKGASATVNKKSIVVGSPRFLIECGVSIEGTTLEKMNTLGRDGKTVIGIAEENTLIGQIALQDTPRDQTIQVMDRIKAKGLRTVMLTGDAKPVAEAIASKIGIEEVKAELLPDDKVFEIEQLQHRGYKVAFVGDGINDAPALAQADVGIAIGAGTDIAIESAGVILIGNKTIDVLNAVILGKASYRTLTGNVIIAVIFNIIGMLLAAVGLISPLLAIAVMIVSIFTILLNTLRVRSIKLESITGANEKQTLTQSAFKIPNMVCEGCAQKITGEIKKLPGIMSIKPKVIQKQIMVNYDGGKVTQDQIKEAITKSGYNPLEV